MNGIARKKVLPHYVVTEVSDANDPNAERVDVVDPLNGRRTSYYIRPKLVPEETVRRDGKPKWVPSQFSLFPMILRGDGSPWPEANLWLLTTLESKPFPNMASFNSIAEDMAAYLRYIEEYQIDWLDFPAQKLFRPTYRFNAHLKHLIQSRAIKPSTAKRRMAAVIRFYRWLIDEHLFRPAFPPWKESDRYIEFKGVYGDSSVQKVITTDVSIHVSKEVDPYNCRIEDGGKLRPLPQSEQEWLLDALISLGNTEMMLIHLFALVTGARIQTILTFRVRDVRKSRAIDSDGLIRIPVGPGYGIDTKNDKKLVLYLPSWFYEKLQVYSASDRAKTRRLRSVGGDSEDQYLFLSIRGLPLYTSKIDVNNGGSKAVRHKKAGQGVRQYITDYIIPFVREKYDPKFHYQFHDTRATFGMNLVDVRMPKVEKGECSLTEVMGFVQARMGHSSSATTERYVNYRKRVKLAHAIQDGWEAKLERMALSALGEEYA